MIIKCIRIIKKRLYYSYQLFNEFTMKIAILDFIIAVIFRKSNSALYKKLFYWKHENIKKFLRKKYGYILNEFNDISLEKEKGIPKKIWVFWWQGKKNFPQIVKVCIDTIIQFNPSYQVTIIDKNNIREFAEIPDYIYEKFNSGNISITHFSDILRFDLLYNRGGVWCDATCFFTKELPCLEKFSFYTIKHGLYSDYHVCKGNWSSFFLAASKKNVYCGFVRRYFFEYWKKQNVSICYFLIDCIMAIGYEDNKYFSKMIDSVPLNNANVFDMQINLNKIVNYERFLELKNNSSIHKLTWKGKLLKTKKNKKTVYGFLMEHLN